MIFSGVYHNSKHRRWQQHEHLSKSLPTTTTATAAATAAINFRQRSYRSAKYSDPKIESSTATAAADTTDTADVQPTNLQWTLAQRRCCHASAATSSTGRRCFERRRRIDTDSSQLVSYRGTEHHSNPSRTNTEIHQRRYFVRWFDRRSNRRQRRNDFTGCVTAKKENYLILRQLKIDRLFSVN